MMRRGRPLSAWIINEETGFRAEQRRPPEELYRLSAVDETLTAYRAAADRLLSAAPGARRGAVEALVALAGADPAARQPVADTICAWLRAPAEPGDPAVAERRAALRLLTDR